VEQEGEGLLGAEEEIRSLCKRLRFRYEPDLDERLRGRIEQMKPWELSRIVRAFSVYFQLVNVAERYHRIRRGRQYDAAENGSQRASIKSALRKLARVEEETDRPGELLDRVLSGMDLSLVLTAHPTKTLMVRVRRKHLSVGRMLDRLDLNRLTPREKGGRRGRARRGDNAALADPRAPGATTGRGGRDPPHPQLFRRLSDRGDP
jgi:phosphoenolpyruvate carboxylase